MAETDPNREHFIDDLQSRLGRFFREQLFAWVDPQDMRVVDEAGFYLTGIPIWGPELAGTEQGLSPHIDIVVKPDRYHGPRSTAAHPRKINLPFRVAGEICQKYGLDVSDFIIDSGQCDLPTITVSIGEVQIYVPEPKSHLVAFAFDTILNYQLSQYGEDKIREWFEKLNLIKEAAEKVQRSDLVLLAEELIHLSIERWKHQGWDWLTPYQG